jgi:1,4-alpha-glucan branching enzyme
MLPLSHDEVVHGKSPMLYKMPGDEWQKFANLRLLYTYMFTHPGAKLLFMGDEFGATSEWNYKTELQWELLQFVSHGGMKHCVQQLNELYRGTPALFENQFSTDGFEWIDLNHRQEGVIVYKRKGKDAKKDVLVVLNMTPVVRENWTVFVHNKKDWKELFNSDNKAYWGTGDVYNPSIVAELVDKPSKCYKLTVHLPALAGIVLG